jgi:hypothetical protein
LIDDFADQNMDLSRSHALGDNLFATETVAAKIREGVREFGVDCDVLILSMARDLIELAAAAS